MSPVRGATSASAASRRRSRPSSIAIEVNVTWRSFELDPTAPREREVDLATHLAEKYGTSREQALAMQQRMSERRRRRRDRVPPRHRPWRQHLRRPPTAAPRRCPRPPGRPQGAPAARLPHRGRADRRPDDARTARRRGRPPRGRGARTCSPASATPPRSATTSARPRRLGSAACRSSSWTARWPLRARSRQRSSGELLSRGWSAAEGTPETADSPAAAQS